MSAIPQQFDGTEVQIEWVAMLGCYLAPIGHLGRNWQTVQQIKRDARIDGKLTRENIDAFIAAAGACGMGVRVDCDEETP